MIVGDKTRYSAYLEPVGYSQKILKKKLKKNFRNFGSKIFFEQKNQNVRAKKLDCFSKFSIEKNILKIRKIIEKCVKKIEIFGQFFQKFSIFFTTFSKFFWSLFGNFFKSKFSKFFKKISKKFRNFQFKKFTK